MTSLAVAAAISRTKAGMLLPLSPPGASVVPAPVLTSLCLCALELERAGQEEKQSEQHVGICVLQEGICVRASGGCVRACD
jgi:hypothetical protein